MPILNFTKSDERRWIPLAHCRHHLTDVSDFLLVSPVTPTANTARQILVVVLERVVLRIEKIFDIVLHHPKSVLSEKKRRKKRQKYEEAVHRGS